MLKIYDNPNKFISKLPTKIPFSTNIKKCTSLIGTQFKIKLSNPKFKVNYETIIQTFLNLYNNSGFGIFVYISKNKLKQFLVFNNSRLIKINNSQLNIIKLFNNVIEKSLNKTDGITCMFFINLTNYSSNIKELIPIISFNSSYDHDDICMPIPYVPNWNNKIKKGISFLFEEDNINESKIILDKIKELKNNPFYKNLNLNYQIINTKNIKMEKIIELYSSIVIIMDPHMPIYFQLLLNSGCEIIVIENKKYYSYYSKLLNLDIEIINWNYDNWSDKLEFYLENNNIKKKLELWFNTNLDINKIILKYIGFLEHNNYIFSLDDKSLPIIQTFGTLEINETITTNQLDINKYYDLLQKNYKMLRCWSYRLNKYYWLLNTYQTNNPFLAEILYNDIRLFEDISSAYFNIHWINHKRVIIDNLELINKSQKLVLKNIYNYIIKNPEDLLNIKIINNNNSIFYIEMPPITTFDKSENIFVDYLELIIQFIRSQPINSSFIIKTQTYHLAQTNSLLEKFFNLFEKIKIIKLKYFEPYMPNRYLIGLNYNPKSRNIIDIQEYNNEFYKIETMELIKVLKFIKSNAIVK
jgi:hypothetical protein